MRRAVAAGALLASLTLSAHAGANQKPTPARPTPPPRLEGTVRDAAGKPIEKALVLARPLSADRFARTLTGRTDAAGRFALALPAAGAYLVRIEAPGLAPHVIDRMAVPAPALAVTLRKGAVIEGVVRNARGQPVAGARVDARAPMRLGTLLGEPEAGRVRATTDAAGAFRLEGLGAGAYGVRASAPGIGGVRRTNVTPGTKLELQLVPGAGVHGTVRGPDRKPLAGATVVLEPEAQAGASFVERTDEKGAFVVWGLPAGAWRAIGFHPDFAPAVAALALEKNAEERLDLTLAPPARVRGRLVDARERPLRGTLVVQELEGQIVTNVLGDMLRADSDAQGRFTMERLPRAPLALAVTARGHVARRLEASPERADLDLGDVVLEEGLAIRGRVVDSAGLGIADASVRAGNLGGPPRPSALEATTEADGTFVLAGAEPGLYRVMAQAAGYAAGSVRTPAAADPVDIVLQRGGSITGTVVDEKGATVPAFEVAASPPEEREDVFRTWDRGSDGRFELSGLAAGEWSVAVKAPEKAEGRVSGVKVRAGQATDVGRIRLAPGASVRGRVTDSAGSPIAGANVRLEQGDRDVSFSGEGVFTDRAGAFEIAGVDPGRVDVVATHPEFAPARTSGVEVDAGRGAADVRVTMTRGGRVEGTARRRDGRPLERAVVRVIGAATWLEAVPVAPDGTFVMDRVPPGSMRVVLFSGSDSTMLGSQQQRPVEIREGETVTVEFLLRDILVSGTVTRRGEPAAGHRLHLRAMMGTFFAGGPRAGLVPPAPGGPQRGWAVTRPDGTYELLVDEPGTYHVSVTSPDGRVSYPARSIEVPDADTATADLTFGGVLLAGQVVDGETSAPVSADVVATPAGENPRPAYVNTGPDGRFQLDVDPGEIELMATARGHAAASTTLTVSENGASDVRLALPRGGTISGRVVDTSGRPVPSLAVMAAPDEPAPWGTVPHTRMGFASAAADGTFTIDGLGEGRYAVSAGDELSGFGLVAGVALGAKDVVLRLSPGGRVRATALRADGSKASSVFVGLTRANGHLTTMGGSNAGMTDAAGVVEFAVPAGTLEVRALDLKNEGYASVAVSPGETAAVEIRLAPRKKDPGTR